MLSTAGLTFGTSIFASAASFRAAAGRATPRLARDGFLAVAMTYSGRGLTTDGNAGVEGKRRCARLTHT
jgi:hypothetical protein